MEHLSEDHANNFTVTVISTTYTKFNMYTQTHPLVAGKWVLMCKQLHQVNIYVYISAFLSSITMQKLSSFTLTLIHVCMHTYVHVPIDTHSSDTNDDSSIEVAVGGIVLALWVTSLVITFMMVFVLKQRAKKGQLSFYTI